MSRYDADLLAELLRRRPVDQLDELDDPLGLLLGRLVFGPEGVLVRLPVVAQVGQRRAQTPIRTSGLSSRPCRPRTGP